MVAFTTRMPSGVPGNPSRPGTPTEIEQNIINTTTPPLRYGEPVKMDSATGQIKPIQAGDTTAAIYGVLVRPFPSNSGTSPLGTSTPPTSGMCDVMKSGYINVKVNSGTPVRGGAVFVRTITGTDTVIGGIAGASDGANTFTWVGAYFTGGVDASGNSEIHFRVN